MELYKLNLRQDITLPAWRTEDWRLLFDPALQAQSNFEALLAWDSGTLITMTEQGPQCRPDVDMPLRCACRLQSSGTQPNAPPITLLRGTYAFTQTRVASLSALREPIDWFAKESWWQRYSTTGLLWIRLVSEDDKTAVQVLQALGESSAETN